MKLKVVVLEAEGQNSLSGWGTVSGGQGPGANAKPGDEFIVEGANVSMHGSDSPGAVNTGNANDTGNA